MERQKDLAGRICIWLSCIMWAIIPYSPAQSQCLPGEVPVYIDITTDDYGSETTWALFDESTSSIVASGGPYFDFLNTTYSSTVCVDAGGCYYFQIYDSFGDGICCANGTGSYIITYGSNVVGSGGIFAASSSVFNIGGQCVVADPLITDNTTYTPEELVTDILLGACVSAFNISYTGDSNAIGQFSNGTTMGMERGILLTSGSTDIAPGPNSLDDATYASFTPGDLDLEQATGVGNTEDAASLEFDFVSFNDTVTFNYIFASEEYNEYVCSDFNDVFAFLVSGAGYAPNTNIALIPGTTMPVAINSINNGTSGSIPSIPYDPANCANSVTSLYVDNTAGQVTQYDGYTVPLTATMVVVPCDTYHIKLVIADVNDRFFDSGVFFEAESFSGGNAVGIEASTGDGTKNSFEGCFDGSFTFYREDSSTINNPVIINFSLSGTAVEGVDYQTIPHNVTIPVGAYDASVNIETFLDGQLEFLIESVILSYSDACNCTNIKSDTLYIIDNQPLEAAIMGDSLICAGSSTTLSASGSGSYATPYQYSWSTLENTPSISVTPVGSELYTVTVTDACVGQTATASLRVGTNSCASDPVDIGLFNVCPDTLEVRLLPSIDFSGIVSNIQFTIRWDSACDMHLGLIKQSLPELQYIPMQKSGVETDSLGYRYQIFFGTGVFPANWTSGTEISLMKIPVVNGCCDFEIVNDLWTGQLFNNGDYYVALDGLDHTGIIYTGASRACDSIPTLTVNTDLCDGDSILIGGEFQNSAGTYYDTLVAANGCDSIVIHNLMILPTGCSDPAASNYDPLAACDDGSCIYDSVDIGLFKICPDTLEVRIRPRLDFDGIFSNVQFTIRWDSACGMNLGSVQQSFPEQGYIPMQKSNGEVDSNGYRYQIFFGTGPFPMSTFGVNWTAGDEIVLMKIPALNGCCDFAIVNDSWTAQLFNNGEFYISLEGANRTGSIYTGASRVCDTIPVDTVAVDICEGDSFFVQGAFQDTAGAYYDTITSSIGCDSIVITNLGILPAGCTDPAANNYDPLAICDDGSCIFDSVDIGLFRICPDTLEVRLLPQLDFSGIVSNVQFTIRWDSSCGVNLGAIKQVFPEIGYLPMQKSNVEIDDNGYRYQVFFGSGQFSINSFSTSWTTGTEVVLMKIPAINGCCNFEIINDAWTGALLNNGDYYTALGGKDHTGNIYTGAVSACDTLPTSTIDTAICDGDSVLAEGMYQFTDGIYYDTVLAASGCDSVVITNLTILDHSFTAISDSICFGDSLLIGGVFQNSSGTYYDTLMAANGCDSVITTMLTVLDTSLTAIDTALCDGDSLFAGGIWQKTSGVYTDIFSAENGCDSTVITTLTILNHSLTSISDSICFGDSLLIGGVFQNSSGTYYDTLLAANGCDSVITTMLTVLDTSLTAIDKALCDGDSVFAGGAWQKTSGIYTDIFSAENGCDSTVITTLTILNHSLTSISDSICFGDSLLVGGVFQNSSGTYYDTLMAANGCDSVITTMLTVLDTSLTAIDTALCDGDSLFAGGIWQKTSGVYTDIFSAENGCDSTVIITLTILNHSFTSISDSICFGDSLLIGSEFQNSSGTYYDTLQAANSCDSIVATVLTVTDTTLTTINTDICDGDSLFAAGAWQTAAGTYIDIFTGAKGCDSTVITNLSILPKGCTDPAAINYDPLAICDDGSCVFDTVDIGLFRICPDTLEVRLLPHLDFNGIVSNIQFTIRWDSACGMNLGNITQRLPEIGYIPMQKSGTEIDKNGYRYQVFFGSGVLPITNFGGSWTSGTELILIKIPVQNGCCNFEIVNDSWTGQVTNNGDYYTALAGLDRTGSIYTGAVSACDTLPTFTIDISICKPDSLLAGGFYQDTSGTYYDTLTAANGCDSVVITNLTILDTSLITINTALCDGDSLFAGGTWQKASGMYIDIFSAANGCDSTIIIHLTILNHSFALLDTSICEGDSLLAGGKFRHLSGTYYDTLTAANSCDSVIATVLTVLDTSLTSISLSICNGDSVFAGGIWQTTSGIYTDILAGENGCDSTIITDLTILSNSFSTTDTSICKGDSLLAGNEYQNSSGTYYDTLPAANGCDSVIATVLTIINNSTTMVSVDICDGDSLFVGNAWQTTGGSYEDIYTNGSGCDSSVITTLSILPTGCTAPSATNYDPLASCDDGSCIFDSVDIGLYRICPDTLEVRLLPQLDFSGIVSNVQFTIRWDTACGMTLGAINQTLPEQGYIPMQKSGAEIDDNGYRYQVFFGSGVFPMNSFGANWTSGTEVVLMKIPVQNGCCDFAVVNDAWTSQLLNNGDYYIALGGLDRAGLIYTGAISVCDTTPMTTITADICDGDSLFAGEQFQDTSGTYYDTLVSANGCDSIVITLLNVLDTSLINIDASICDGDSLFIAGAWQTSAGVYTDIFPAANGCDSTVITTLNILYHSFTSINDSICFGDSLFIGGDFQTSSGTYYDTLTAMNGCDSIVSTLLSVFDTSITHISTNICQNDSLFVGGAWQNTSGTYEDRFTSIYGCDSLVITELSIDSILIDQIDIVICSGDSFFAGNGWQDTSGSYADTAIIAGCFSITMTNLTVADTFLIRDTAIICQGDSIFVGGSWQTTPGTYIDQYTTTAGCDSSIVTFLSVNDTNHIFIDTTICQGQSYFAGGALQTISGTYTDIYPNINNCDSIVTTTLTVSDTFRITNNRSICEGDSLYVGGAWQKTAGTYFDFHTTVDGCDSTIITNLTVDTVITTTRDIEICAGESYFAGGADQTTTGTYIDSFIAAGGCDSVAYTNLIVLDTFITNVPTSICQGDSMFLEGEWQKMSGTFTDTLSAANGCDSIIVTALSVTSTVNTASNDTICLGDSILLEGAFQFTPGIYSDTLSAAAGCDSVHRTTLAVIQINLIDEITTICEDSSTLLSAPMGFTSYNWSGGEDTSTIEVPTGTYQLTVTDANNCTASARFVVNQADSIGLYTDPLDSTRITEGESAIIRVLHTGSSVTIADYTWTPDSSLSCNNCNQAEAAPVRDIIYTIVATDEYGCSEEVRVKILVDRIMFDAPNIFTPNNDGNNDDFYVFVEGYTYFKLMIFDRWGEKMFETYDPYEGWDGTYKGELMPPAVYIYYVAVDFIDDQPAPESYRKLLKGSVTLIR